MSYKLVRRGKRGVPRKARLEERIGPRITLVGSLIAVFVGVNTLVTTCSTRTTSHYQGFRQAVEVEETYWRNLYNDYFALLREPPEQRGARMLMLSHLAERPVPAFHEFELGLFGGDDGARDAASARLTELRDRMQEALNRAETSSPLVVAARQDQNFRDAVGERLQQREDGEAIRANEAVVTTFATTIGGVIYQPQTLTLGDARGLDLDVFWCGGGGEAAERANYANGLAAARRLAAKAGAGEPLAAGLPYGRVRLIMLPESRQNTSHRADGGGGFYPARGSGLTIQSDADADERGWAQALAGQLGGGYRVVTASSGTHWYISLFSCAAGGGRLPAANARVPAGARR